MLPTVHHTRRHVPRFRARGDVVTRSRPPLLRPRLPPTPYVFRHTTRCPRPTRGPGPVSGLKYDTLSQQARRRARGRRRPTTEILTRSWGTVTSCLSSPGLRSIRPGSGRETGTEILRTGTPEGKVGSYVRRKVGGVWWTRERKHGNVCDSGVGNGRSDRGRRRTGGVVRQDMREEHGPLNTTHKQRTMNHSRHSRPGTSSKKLPPTTTLVHLNFHYVTS